MAKWLLILAFVVSLAFPKPALAQSATISADISVEAGATGVATLRVAAATDIAGYDLDITCSNGAVLYFDSIQAGEMPDGYFTFQFLNSPTSATATGFMTSAPATDVIVATITFKAVGNPGNSANISVTGFLYDSDTNELQGVAFGGATIQIVEAQAPPPEPPTLPDQPGAPEEPDAPQAPSGPSFSSVIFTVFIIGSVIAMVAAFLKR